ncbi:relaxase/mobilization nuclease domain-containing protein [Streptomyces sp. NRRL WC-3742]|uniref:relaxase/mobilization nuclease domain-containing protein n=1 Tax=Streptomyces sp. NRRL WC-3742 TaxID=1463934 RepID=UPI00068B1C53|nr:relaxase/mobilization nuclease domain-containing protein [Streptomyces sp. NRRL WC-3742]
MISKAVHGNDTLGALRYLYGPGKANEHTDPHIVASWDGFVPDPGRHPSATLEQLGDALDLHVLQYGRKVNNHVYHRMIRADPGDRILDDEDWAAIAHRVMAAAGIAPDGDEDACRWVAVRHADNHIHILATVVRADLTQARLYGDQYRVEDELTKIERQYGLKDLSDTRTREYRDAIPKRATGAEIRKAERLGREGTDRDRLRTAVRQALAGAADEEEFTARLAANGVLFGVRRAPSGDVTGYKFALPTGDETGPVWFSGSKLASDLTQPKIRARFTAGIDQPAPTPDPRTWPAVSRHRASTTIEHAYPAFDDGQDAARAEAAIRGGLEVLDTLAATSPTLSRKEINQAARALEYTRIAHTRAAGADLRAMRSAARELLHAGPANGRGEDGTAAATILTSLVLLAIVIAKWHAAQGHRHQAEAAHTAAQHLRAAYARHAAKPIAHLTLEGRLLPKPDHDRQAATVRRTLPADQATRLLAEDNWAALAATLAQAEAAGHDPTTLLTNAAGRRELATADSPAAVLTWRIRRDAHLPAPAPAATPDELRTRAALSRSTTGRASASTVTTTVPPAPPVPPTVDANRPRR